MIGPGIMASWRLRLLSALALSVAAMAAGEPSCDGVADFYACTGDANGFCPEGIGCSCKDGRPFCSCPYYKGPQADYWYMGSRCDSLWSTWDLIVVTVVPAVALAFVVAVTAQWIHFCKSKKQPRKISEPATHQNPAFVPEVQPRSPYEDLAKADLYAQIRKNNVQEEPSRSNPYSANRASAYGNQRLMPQPDYDYDYNQHRSQQHYPQVQLGRPGLPRTDYDGYTDYPNGRWENRGGR